MLTRHSPVWPCRLSAAVVIVLAAVTGCRDNQPAGPESSTTLTLALPEPPREELLVGEFLQLRTVVRSRDDAVLNVPVRWASSNPRVATVSQSGHVYGVATGTVTISVAYAGQVRGQRLRVLPNTPGSIVLVNPPTQVDSGGTRPLAPEVRSTHGLVISAPSVEWSSDHPAIAVVGAYGGSSGVVRGISTGSTTIRVKSGGVEASYPIRVRSVIAQSLEIVGGTDTLLLYGSASLTAHAIATDGLPLARTPVWSATGDAVTVAPNGVVTGRVAGTSTVTATLGGLSAHRAVVVHPFARFANSLNFRPLEELVVGESLRVEVLALAPSGVGPVEPAQITSGNPEIATIEANNIVRAVAPGTVALIASARVAAPVSATLRIHPRTTSPAVPAVETLSIAQGNSGGWRWYYPTIVMQEASGQAGYRVLAVRATLVGTGVTESTPLFARVNPGATRRLWDDLDYYYDPFAIVTPPGAPTPTAMTVHIDYVDDAGNTGTVVATVSLQSGG